MNPTLYDILGVRPEATPAEIKKAWRDAADRFEPGAGSSGAQFRLFNEAAEVLLDPDRRREYDAGLDLPEGPAEPAEPTEPAEPAEPAEPGDDGGDRAAQEAGPEPAPAGVALGAADGVADGGRRSGGPSTPVLAGLGLLALVMVALAAWWGLHTWSLSDVREQDRADEAAHSAPAAAERAAATILAYDYTSLATDEKAAEGYMTTSYGKEYAKTFDSLVTPNAKKLKAKVKASVRASSVQHADADRVNVLLFVNQVTTSTANDGKPQTALNRVELAMVRSGDRWLVDDITSY